MFYMVVCSTSVTRLTYICCPLSCPASAILETTHLLRIVCVVSRSGHSETSPSTITNVVIIAEVDNLFCLSCLHMFGC